jgi:hypothetical protein
MARRKVRRKKSSFGKKLAKDPMRIGLVIALHKRTVPQLKKLKEKPGAKKYRHHINAVIKHKGGTV